MEYKEVKKKNKKKMGGKEKESLADTRLKQPPDTKHYSVSSTAFT